MQFDVDMQSVQKELFLEVRDYLLSFEGVEETKKERITTYGNPDGGICHMRTTKTGVDVGFLKGARIEDKHALLTGTSKKMRVLSLTSLNKDVMGYYLEESIRLNQL